jgi:hypothetical protein
MQRRKSKNWSSLAPHTMTERQNLASRCGRSRCFLRPSNLGFPICSYRGNCSVDCRGLNAAKSRARQFGYSSILNKSKYIKSCTSNIRRSKSRHRSKSHRRSKSKSRRRSKSRYRSKSRRRSKSRSRRRYIL